MSQANQPKLESTPAPRERFRWRRLFQYKLRTLFILTTLVAAWFAWWSVKVRPQQQAVAAIRAAGGWVEYDFEYDHLVGPPYWPKWFVDAIGVDYFANVEDVTIYTERDTDAALNVPKGLISLTRLHLAHSDITDAGLEHLKGLTRLEVLDLSYTNVTDAGLQHLKGLTNLGGLGLQYTKVTDAGLEHLKRLTSLGGLVLSHTKVTDAGVIRLQKSLPKCTINH